MNRKDEVLGDGRYQFEALAAASHGAACSMSEDRTLERLGEMRKANAALASENAVLRGALLAVQEWKLPYPGFSWQNGSNGERDHFRAVAATALQFKSE